MTNAEAFDAAFAQFPLVAILRGVRPDEIVAIGTVLMDEGFTLIEIPLNSPDPLESVHRLAAHAGDAAMIGAGTVLTPAAVEQVRAAGGRMIISPNTNAAVIEASVQAGLASLPGFATPSEAFVALEAGATALKLFPAEAGGPPVLKAVRAVLPPATRVLPVGGITPDTMAAWRAAGAAGFGLGSALYAPGLSPQDVRERARAFRTALQA